MALRAQAFEPSEFTVLFFTLLTESENDESFGREKLYPWCMERFNDDQRAAESFIDRFLSLIKLIDHEQAQPYVFVSNNVMKLHPAMLEVAATLRTRKNGSFPDRRFFAEVDEIAECHYADFRFSEET